MVIVNPASANGSTRKDWPAIAAKMKHFGIEFDWKMTAGPGDATRLATEAIHEGYRAIIAVGGDGTLNEVVNGLVDDDRPICPEVVIGVISRGTGCDFIKAMGIPKDVDRAVECLAGGVPRIIDLGKVRFASHNGGTAVRYYANIADVGLGGETVDRVNKTSKAMGGFASFLWGTMVSLLRYRNRPARVTIDDGEAFSTSVTVLAIANGRYFGGGMKISPLSDPSDGLLDVVLCHHFSKLEVILNLNRLYKGTHLSHRKVEHHRASRVIVSSNSRVLLDVDGEQPGTVEAEFGIVPSALKVCVPSDL